MKNMLIALLVFPFLTCVNDACASSDQWRTSSPFPGPSRWDAGLVLDHRTQKVWIYGGVSGHLESLGDMWTYDLRHDKWEKMDSGADGPGERAGHVMSFDNEGRQIYLFGGKRSKDDLWRFLVEKDAWEPIIPADGVRPTGRHQSSMEFDPVTGSPWVFFGFFGIDQPLSDYLRFDPDELTWTRHFPPSMGPRRRTAHVTGFDENRGRVMLYGGFSPIFGSSGLADVWALDIGNNEWSKLATDEKGTSHRGAVGSYDGVSDLFLVYGGELSPSMMGDPRNQLVGFDPNELSWKKLLNSEAGAPRRTLAAGTYCPCSGEMFVFGGDEGFRDAPPSDEAAFFVSVETKAEFQWVSGPRDKWNVASKRWGLLKTTGSLNSGSRLIEYSVVLMDCSSGRQIARPTKVKELRNRGWLMRFEGLTSDVEQVANKDFLRLTGRVEGEDVNFLAPVPGVRDAREGVAYLQSDLSDWETTEPLEQVARLEITPRDGIWDIQWHTSDGKESQVEILDLRGRILMKKTVVIDNESEKNSRFSWNGVDSRGRLVPSGVYFVRVRTGRSQETGKVFVR